MYKSVLAVLLVAGVLAVGVFGVFAMSGGEHHTSTCLGSLANSAPCPEGNSVLDDIGFHASAFRNFSLATITGSGILLLTALAGYALLFAISPPLLAPARSSCRRLLPRTFSPLHKRAHSRWFALHENSPARF